MNYFEIKKTSNPKLIPITYDSITYNKGIFIIAIKIQINCNDVKFEPDNTAHKYKIIENSNSTHIEIIEYFDPDNDSNYSLKFYFNCLASGSSNERILKITIPLENLNNLGNRCEFRFCGENSNKGRQNVETEEGIIIFEPPTKNKHKRNQPS